MTFNQREFRSPHSHVTQVLDRLYRESSAGNRAVTSFSAICNMISIPRDLRAGLLEQLLREGYVTREGDKVRLTEAGTQLALAPVTPPDNTIQNPSPLDSESRARMRGSGRQG